jgi:hypothetical protein
MKIQTQLNKTADKISLSSSTLTINGKDYDLENVKPLSENESCENQRVCSEGKDIIIFFKINVELQFMFMSYNLMRFYDINENNLIDLSELKLIIDHWNLPEDEREAERVKIMDVYLAVKGNTKESWKLKGVPKE